MARQPRIDIGNYPYHILNRANARLKVFFNDSDYELFESILAEATEHFDMRLLSYCLMPNHFHLVIYPKKDGDIQKYMQWITLTHTQRWHREKNTTGTGHLYQGRYKSFVIQDDNHLLSVIRYVERNPLRAKLIKKAENWEFSSLAQRLQKKKFPLSVWPINEPKNYLAFINEPMNESELLAIRSSVQKGNILGSGEWKKKMEKRYNIAGRREKAGRPKKNGT